MDKCKSFVFPRQYRNYFSRRINALLPRNQPKKTAIGMVMNDFHGSKTMIFHWIADVAYFSLAVRKLSLFSWTRGPGKMQVEPFLKILKNKGPNFQELVILGVIF